MLARTACFFFLGHTGDVHERGGRGREGKRAVRRKEKALRGKQLLKRSNTGEGDTLTSCMRCHGYQSPVCHPFLAPPPTYWRSRGNGKTQKGGEKETMKGGKGVEK